MKASKLVRSLAVCGAVGGLTLAFARGGATSSHLENDRSPAAIGWTQPPEFAPAEVDRPLAGRAAGSGVVSADGIRTDSGIQQVEGRWKAWVNFWTVPQANSGKSGNSDSRSRRPQPNRDDTHPSDELGPRPDARYQGGSSVPPSQFPPSAQFPNNSHPEPFPEPAPVSRSPRLRATPTPTPVDLEPVPTPVTATPGASRPSSRTKADDFEPVPKRGTTPRSVPQPAAQLPAPRVVPRPSFAASPRFAGDGPRIPTPITREEPVPEPSDLDSPPASPEPTVVEESPALSRPVEPQPVTRAPQPSRPVVEEPANGPTLFGPTPSEPVDLQPVPRVAERDEVVEPPRRPESSRPVRSQPHDHNPPAPHYEPVPERVQENPYAQQRPPQYDPRSQYDPRFRQPDPRSRQQQQPPQQNRSADGFMRFFPLMRR